MPIETGPRSIYRNLCSEDDPPRSVAICPQRRCVAFGCSSGIELHWIDALTGQDLNRWFPLTVPSDYLYFLPPRRSVDSAKKLRLISSAASPSERPAIAERQTGGRSRTSPYWEGLTRSLSQVDDPDCSEIIRSSMFRYPEIGRRVPSGRMDVSDHYRAIPLSDGYHVLFTDPTTGLLCLGSDAPVGGPTKLLRKIWFEGPPGQGSPIAYVGGSDLSSGVRVVATYGTREQQSIWFFTVPHDIFLDSQNGSASLLGTTFTKLTSTQSSLEAQWAPWWPDGLQEWFDHAPNPGAGTYPRSVWPVKIRGQQVGTCKGLVDVAIASCPEMPVWAFSKDGTATCWKMDTGSSDEMRKHFVARDGRVKEINSDIDSSMTRSDFPTPEILEPPLPLFQETLDGTVSWYGDSFRRDSRRNVPVPCQHCMDPGIDADGDVVMTDFDPSDHEISVEEVEHVRDIRSLEYEVFRDEMRRLERRLMATSHETIDEVFGIIRLELEIY